jgi:two-component system, chemotaxis family, sensor kinase CheA
MAATDELRATFFQECEDLLERMSEGLNVMAFDPAAPDIEAVHAVFRAVHSIKGGAGAFGLTDLVTFAHTFETVLDLMRSGRLEGSVAVMQRLLRASDVLSDLVNFARDDGSPDQAQVTALLLELDQLADGGGNDAPDEVFDFQPLALDLGDLGPAGPDADQPPGYDIRFAPKADFYAIGHEPAAHLLALAEFGETRVTVDLSNVQPLADHDLLRPRMAWSIRLLTAASLQEIATAFEFVDDLVELDIRPLDGLPGSPDNPLAAGPDTGAGPASDADLKPATPPATPDHLAPLGGGLGLAPTPDQVPPTATGRTPAPPDAGAAKGATIRVNLDRVDRLINQIGELVIKEAMLSQVIDTAGLLRDSDISNSLDGIKQLASEIQESVMAIRAQPLKPVFQRMQRIVREAADATGKEVRLLMLGEATEVDKTMIERLVDPLTHMIRNSVDHGIETAARRRAAGKPPEGVITLSAAHRSGRVLIEVSDDGGGIDRPRVRDIAEARGLVPAGAALSAAEIDNLLFLPGFSSKSEVSALSGRGVGLDVVRREIQGLGGRVTIQSVPGQGTTFTIALPLTLAVLEGMLVSVGGEMMVLPLSAIVETLRASSAQVHPIGLGGRVISCRGELIPIIDLAQSFGFPGSTSSERSVLILVEGEAGRRAALAVDHIHDQRQVVIKSLEENYGNVPQVAAATILGDGRIALIIDPEEILNGSLPDFPQVSLAANG